ncbi:MAG: PAC2 family protein [Deltaproteobacteria bacterium]|nr:PAC2 family protein [Deltaproteobacteria bacterium]
MKNDAIGIKNLPELRKPILIAGFGGWGNALDISNAMVTYLIRQLKAESFARIDPDLFYRYDENRPIVNIKEGVLKSVSPPGGSFFAAHPLGCGTDLVLFRAVEPSLRWSLFADELLRLCGKLGVSTIITLGSMYDNVLHTDRIISGIASEEDLSSKLKEKAVMPINYQGPSAIHSTLHQEGKKRGFPCISLWCHCPYYLQGTTHFGLMSHLGALLASLGEFVLDVEELDASWKELNKQIQKLIEKNPELQDMISELRKAKVRGSWESVKEGTRKDEKVIHIEDFIGPR